jgi:hypothetical protein
MSFYDKIKTIASTMSGYNVIVDTSNGANVEFDRLEMPAILILIQQSGTYNTANSHYRDSSNVRIIIFNKIPQDFKSTDIDTIKETLKEDLVRLHHKIRYNFDFKINSINLNYDLVYDEYDANLIGVVMNDTISERVGLNLACEDSGGGGVGPSPSTFCELISECGTIITMQELIESLQEQIDNLPTTNDIGLIKIIDLDGFFFTDLATANAYVSQFTNATITDESFNDGVYYFTVPQNTAFANAGNFLGDAIGQGFPNASIVDELGLITSFGDNLLYNSKGNNVLGNCLYYGNPFTNTSGINKLGDILMDDPIQTFANSATNRFILNGNLGTDETYNIFGFFQSSTATIFVPKEKYISNAGGINGNLLFAISQGCNVFYDGIDKEDVKNKATDFTVLDNVKYPTTQATKDLVDYYVQSNIKIIGDWDASSGSYPLADESNTTPFIAQWGATIKAGWAFRVGYGQAGTVDGFDYENGDVVYALVDSPIDDSSNWGDLDHNLQQANESIRGTAKIVTAVIIADETSTDDERIVTTKKLWLNFWTRVLAIAHTFAAKITFTTSPRFDSVTASQYLKVDSNKDLTSVYAIPATDITEDSTHRFATDTEKTEWNNKINLSALSNIFSSCVVTGWSSYTNSVVEVIDLGNCRMINIHIRGTSNSTVASVKFPFTYNGTAQLLNTLTVTNSGTNANGKWDVLAGSDTIVFYTSINNAAFTASGTKAVFASLILPK